MHGVVGILLAAGAGTRYGSSNKLLVPLADGTPVAVASARVLSGVLPESVAVIRPGDQTLRRLLEDQGLRIVECERARDGMGFSLAAGVAAASAATGWVITLADMPWIRQMTVQSVADRVKKGARLVAPVFRGRRGHPVGFGVEFRAELLACAGDEGARAVLQRHTADVEMVEVEDAGILHDVDTPGDLSTRY